jgi:hypothetical protein
MVPGNSAVLGAEPPRPMFAFHAADVGRAAVQLHPEQFFEIDRLALVATYSDQKKSEKGAR